jgi:hypothetical protein
MYLCTYTRDMIRKLLVTSTFLLQCLLALAQIPRHIANQVSGEEYDTKDFTLAKTAAGTRTRVYHFGESEGEWDLALMQNGSQFIVQVAHGQWATHYYTKQLTWQQVRKTFNTVVVSGNKITFGNCTALLVDYRGNDGAIFSLLLDADPFTGKKYKPGYADVGQYSMTLTKWMGDEEENQLSATVLPESYFRSKTAPQLRIMRNMVYAKYGLLFQPGGEMEKYFKAKSWYDPYLHDVADLLTAIEKENITTIMRVEKTISPAH